VGYPILFEDCRLSLPVPERQLYSSSRFKEPIVLGNSISDSTIRINVFNSYCPSNPSIAATVVHSRDMLMMMMIPMNPTITIYLDALEVSDSAINWKAFLLPYIYSYTVLQPNLLFY
jgi:hypothetical protein